MTEKSCACTKVAHSSPSAPGAPQMSKPHTTTSSSIVLRVRNLRASLTAMLLGLTYDCQTPAGHRDAGWGQVGEWGEVWPGSLARWGMQGGAGGLWPHPPARVVGRTKRCATPRRPEGARTQTGGGLQGHAMFVSRKKMWVQGCAKKHQSIRA